MLAELNSVVVTIPVNHFSVFMTIANLGLGVSAWNWLSIMKKSGCNITNCRLYSLGMFLSVNASILAIRAGTLS